MTQRHNGKIVHSMGIAKNTLAEAAHMAVVAHSHSQTYLVSNHCTQGDDTLPRHVGRILYAARKKIAAGRTHTYRAYVLKSAVLFCHLYKALAKHPDKTIDVWIFISLNRISIDNSASYVHYSIYSLI